MTAVQGGALSAAERSMRSVFVGNIPYEATEERLKVIFSEVGPVVSFRLVFDRETGKPKGYGFCEYKDQEMALSAMRNLNGYELNGRTLRVDNAASEKSNEELKNLQVSLGEPPVESPYGPPCSPAEAPYVISKIMAGLPYNLLMELMIQMKTCVENNPNEARTLLMQNPQLTYALLQAQVITGIVTPDEAKTMLYNGNPFLKHASAVPSTPDAKQVASTSTPSVSTAMNDAPSFSTGMNPRALGHRDLMQMPISGRDMQASSFKEGENNMRHPAVNKDLGAINGPGRRQDSRYPYTTSDPHKMPHNDMGNMFPGGMQNMSGGNVQNRHSMLQERGMSPANSHGTVQVACQNSPQKESRNLQNFQAQNMSNYESGMFRNDHINRRPMFGPITDDDLRNINGPMSSDPIADHSNRRPMFGPITENDLPKTNGPMSVNFKNPRFAAAASAGLPAVGGASPNPAASPRSNSALAATIAAITNHDQDKAALITQVLQLSDEQIATLPPEQRQSVLILREKLARATQDVP